MGTRILLANSHKIVRQGLRSLIERQTDFEVSGEAENGKMAIDLADKLLPHIIIMDVLMPVMSGIEATRHISKEIKDVKVIALSEYPDNKFVKEMVKAGARGYLLKDCPFDELIHAINAVSANKFYLSPMVADGVIEDYRQYLTKVKSSPLHNLTTRENEVLKLVAEGETIKQISSRLSLSVKTVEFHRRKVMGKLNIDNSAGLARYAIKEGLISLDV